MPHLPYLSVVATGRNDDHGGNLLKRMQMFVSGVCEQAERHRVPLELILVEWNPPGDKPALCEVLTWPCKSHEGFAQLRIIQVPRERHARYKHADRLPLYQMIAKNVGIRRARAPFILATNIDILFSDELFQYFSQGRLEPGKIYRVDRLDINEHIPATLTLDQQLEYCRQNVVRINHLFGSIHTETGHYHRHYASDIELYPEEVPLPIFHTNACGDFQLMAAHHWHSIRGYAEFDMYSMHLDSLTEYAAHFSGAREHYLRDPYRIYHIEHQSGWTPEAQRDGSFDRRYDQQKIAKLTDEQLQNYLVQMYQSNSPTIFNDDNWGLEGEELIEQVYPASTGLLIP